MHQQTAFCDVLQVVLHGFVSALSCISTAVLAMFCKSCCHASAVAILTASVSDQQLWSADMIAVACMLCCHALLCLLVMQEELPLGVVMQIELLFLQATLSSFWLPASPAFGVSTLSVTALLVLRAL